MPKNMFAPDSMGRWYPRTLKTGEGLAAKFGGRHALDFQEAAVEVRHIVKAHFVANVGDLLF
jgi:hypothetical protein